LHAMNTKFHSMSVSMSISSRLLSSSKACVQWLGPHQRLRLRLPTTMIIPWVNPTISQDASLSCPSTACAPCTTFLLLIATTGNELGIYASWDHLYAPDLPVYYKNWTSPQIPSDVEPEFISIYGGKRGTQSMAEANRASESALDIQTTQSIIYPQKVRLYQVGASEYISSFNIFLDALVSIMSHSA
jgi:hypothetical protein